LLVCTPVPDLLVDKVGAYTRVGVGRRFFDRFFVGMRFLPVFEGIKLLLC